MNDHANSLLRLPGTAEEQKWLREHLETLSVRERIVLTAAMQRSPPATRAEAVNHLLTLDEYDVLPANSYEALGEFYLWEKCVPEDQRQFFDKVALGQWYEDEHPGLFIWNSYVAYPEQDQEPYDGKHLPDGMERLDWSVRLKLASETVPEGVWVKLPDYSIDGDDRPDEIHLALDALRVKNSTNAPYWKRGASCHASGTLPASMIPSLTSSMTLRTWATSWMSAARAVQTSLTGISLCWSTRAATV